MEAEENAHGKKAQKDNDQTLKHRTGPYFMG
jgi:hypothetical protein